MLKKIIKNSINANTKTNCLKIDTCFRKRKIDFFINQVKNVIEDFH